MVWRLRARGSLLTLHAAAGLCDGISKSAARLLRSSEGMVRTAIVVLSKHKVDNSTPKDDKKLATVDAPSVPPLESKARRRNRRRRDGARKQSMMVDVVHELETGATGTPALSCQVDSAMSVLLPPTRPLKPQTSRERSPRRPASLPTAVGEAGMEETWRPVPGRSAVLGGILSKPELNGKLVTVVSWLPDRSRWATRLESGEQITVNTDALQKP